MAQAVSRRELTRSVFFPRRVEFVFETEVGPEVGTAAVGFAKAFANGAVNGEILEELVLEANICSETVRFAGFFAADEVDFGKQSGFRRDLVFLGELEQQNVVFGGFDAAELLVGEEGISDIHDGREPTESLLGAQADVVVEFARAKAFGFAGSR